MNIAVIILTFNSEKIIGRTVAQAYKTGATIYVVDSNSKDETVQIAASMGCVVIKRPFINYSDQRNWIISELNSKCDWQLHLDADEIIDDETVLEVISVIKASAQSSKFSYMLRRRDYFMGKMLKHSGVNPWHLRLFRSGHGRCENRLYDQHFISDLPAKKLGGFMHDVNTMSLSEWTIRHNRWSDLECAEAISDVQTNGVLKARLLGDPRERTRFLKKTYYSMLPSGLRTVGYFAYRYFVRLGFLDGREGFYFAAFQAFWFRTLVDAKIHEATSALASGR